MAKRSRPDGADHPDRRRSAGCGRPEWCGVYCCELMARHAIDRGARSAHRGRDRACGGDIRRRAAPLSNPRPAQPALPAIRSVARARTADGIRRLPCPRSRDPTARSCLPCGHRRLAPRHPPAARPNCGCVLQCSCCRRVTSGAGRQHVCSHSRQHSTRREGQSGQRREAPGSAAAARPRRDVTCSHAPPCGMRT